MIYLSVVVLEYHNRLTATKKEHFLKSPRFLYLNGIFFLAMKRKEVCSGAITMAFQRYIEAPLLFYFEELKIFHFSR